MTQPPIMDRVFGPNDPSKWSTNKLTKISLEFADVFGHRTAMHITCEDLIARIKKDLDDFEVATLASEEMGGLFFRKILLDELRKMLVEYAGEQRLEKLEFDDDADFLDFLLSDTAVKYFGFESQEKSKSIINLFKMAISRALVENLENQNNSTAEKIMDRIDKDVQEEQENNPTELQDIEYLINTVLIPAISGQGQVIYDDFLEFKDPTSVVK